MTGKKVQVFDTKEKVLPDERYDMKLFKQAVKASKEAKVIERKRKRKKEFLKVLYSISIVLAFALLIYFLLPLFAPKDEYTLAQEYPRSISYEKIETEKISLEKNIDITISSLSGESIIAFNPLNGDILYEKNINEKRSIASLTKLDRKSVV